MKPGEQTLEELYQEARADIARGGSDVALKWAFKHAKAVRRRARAEQSAKVHENDRTRQLYGLGPDAVTALEQTSASLYADAFDLAEARAAEMACEHVWQIATRTPRQQQPAAQRQGPKAA